MKSAHALPVLVIEDSAEDFDTVREAARRIGVANELVHAVDAAGARKQLHEAFEGRRSFAFVLLDQSLPGTNGDGLLSEMRSQPALKLLPVIVLSGSSRSADCNRCYDAGANAYHIKPVRFEEHLATVQSIFRYWLDSAVLPDARRDSHRG